MFTRVLLVFIVSLLISFNGYATQCAAIFPGIHTFAADSVDTIDSNVTCNGTNCFVAGFTHVSPFPSISSSGSFNSSTISDGLSQHTSWGMGENAVVTFTGSGTAVLYFKNDVTILKNSEINKNGDPENLLIVVKGKLKVEEGSTINAFIYVKGDETNFEENTTLNGSVSTIGKLILKKNSTYNYDARDIYLLDSHGFCTEPALNQCNAVFPDAFQDLVSTTNQLLNFPVNNSNANLAAGTTLPRGDNFYLDESIGTGGEIYVGAVVGSETTARLYFRGGVNLHNAKINETGNPEDLIIVIDGALAITGGDTIINAIIYVKGAATMNGAVTINGSVTVLGTSSLSGDAANLNYDASAIGSADFNNMCAASTIPSVVLDMRFDEIGWSGANAVIDSSVNNYHGTANNSTPTAGLICNAANLTAVGNNDYIQVNANVMNDLTDFTISVWGKTSNNDNQSLLSAANSSSFNEVVMFFNNNTQFDPYLNNSQTTEISTTSLSDDIWHHLVWTRADTTNCLYIDGMLQGCITHPAGQLSVENLILGQEQDSNGGGFEASEGWEGLVDELLIFDGAIEASTVTSIYNNQLIGKNWDGSTRTSSCTAAWWQLENDFTDSTPNEPHSLLTTGTPTFSFDNPGPAYTNGVESTCSYVSFDGSNYASIDDSGDFNFQDLSVSAWINPSSYAASSTGLRSLVSKDEHFEFHINGDGKLYWWWRNLNGSSHTLTSSTAIGLDTWTHVAVVYDSSGTQSMYINGALEKSANFTDGLANTPCDFYIGTDVGTGSSTVCGGVLTNRNFQGHMDEVRLYDRVLSLAEIQADMNVVHSCNLLGVDHYQIDHDGYGLTCDTENITITACADASCDNLFTADVTLDFQAGGSLKDTPTFTGSTGVSFNHTIADSSLTLSVANPSIDPDNPLDCNNGGSCDMNFADAGFIFSGFSAIEVAGKAIAPLTGVTIQAVEKNTTNGTCSPLFSGTKNIDFAVETISPNTPSGNVTVSKYTIGSDAINLNSSGAVNNYKTVSLSFGADDSTATLSDNTYFDAGSINLHAKYVIAATTGNPAVTLNGSTLFTVRPDHFVIIPKNKDDTLFTGSADNSPDTQLSGEPFSLLIEAVNEQGNRTVNYKSKTIDLALKLIGPLNGVSGKLTDEKGLDLTANIALSYSDTILFGDGFYETKPLINTTNGAKYSEVGLIELHAQEKATLNPDNDGNKASGSSNIGRFTPAYFKQTIEDAGAITANHGGVGACLAQAWVYSGQQTAGIGTIKYAVEPILTITAYNDADNVTQNYIGNYAKLINSNIDLLAPVSIHANALPLTANIASDGSLTEIGAGVLEYELSDQHHFTYTRNAASIVAPFTANFEIPIDQITDSDGIQLRPSSGGTDYFVNPSFSSGVEVKFGRWFVENSFGPETSNLVQPMYAQYLAGSGQYIANSDDNCSVISTASNELILTDGTLDKDLSGVNTITELLSGGINRSIVLTAPNSQGDINIEYTVPTWFQFDWSNADGNNDGPYTENPSAVATFGLYRGNDRIISWREVGN